VGTQWRPRALLANNGRCGHALRERTLESEKGVKGEGKRGMERDERPGTLHIHAGEGMEGTSAYDRAPGRRHSEHIWMTIWVSSVLNLDMGQLQDFLIS
jgi:hypothetical protein